MLENSNLNEILAHSGMVDEEGTEYQIVYMQIVNKDSDCYNCIQKQK